MSVADRRRKREKGKKLRKEQAVKQAAKSMAYVFFCPSSRAGFRLPSNAGTLPVDPVQRQSWTGQQVRQGSDPGQAAKLEQGTDGTDKGPYRARRRAWEAHEDGPYRAQRRAWVGGGQVCVTWRASDVTGQPCCQAHTAAAALKSTERDRGADLVDVVVVTHQLWLVVSGLQGLAIDRRDARRCQTGAQGAYDCKQAGCRDETLDNKTKNAFHAAVQDKDYRPLGCLLVARGTKLFRFRRCHLQRLCTGHRARCCQTNRQVRTCGAPTNPRPRPRPPKPE